MSNRGHRLQELDFEQEVGGFAAHDYFGDGSFYLLDVPGVSRFPFDVHRHSVT